MSTNVEAVNERLNSLVTLLKAVGIDSLDKAAVDRVSKNLAMAASSSTGKSGTNRSGTSKLDDEQIEAIIRKLQMAQQQTSDNSPQIFAALEAATGRGGARTTAYNLRKQQQRKQHQPEPGEEEEEEEEDEEEEEEEEEDEEEEEEEEEEDEEEEDDEFDEDANYPMVGHGVSDDISVVSDLTTPTVVSSLHIAEEEHYCDTLPPLIVGGSGNNTHPSMMIAPSKRKNLVGSVRPARSGNAGVAQNQTAARRLQQQQLAKAAAAPGGAAASRRKNYNAAMDKLASPHPPKPINSTSTRKAAVQQQQQPHQPQQRLARTNSGSGNAALRANPSTGVHYQSQPPQQQQQQSSEKRRVPRKSSLTHVPTHSASLQSTDNDDGWGQGWNAFSNTVNPTAPKHASSSNINNKTPVKPIRKPATGASPVTTMIDDDGFLMTDAFETAFDPFDTSALAAAPQSRSTRSMSPHSSSRQTSTPRKKKTTGTGSANPSSRNTAGVAPNSAVTSATPTTRRTTNVGNTKAPPTSSNVAETKRRVGRRASLDV